PREGSSPRAVATGGGRAGQSADSRRAPCGAPGWCPSGVVPVGPSDGCLLQPAALPLGEPTPDAEALVVGQRVLQALGTDLAGQADLLGLAGGAALLREE